MEVARRDDRTLRRIAAMLIALAALAERAGSRSFPVRWLVLTILRRAEEVARWYVVEATQTDWPDAENPLEIQCRPVDAVLLALRFRMLAAVLGALLSLASLFDGSRIDGPPRRFESAPAGAVRRPATGRGDRAIRRCAHDPPESIVMLDLIGHVAEPLRGAPAQAVSISRRGRRTSIGSILNGSLPGATFPIE